jgi:hypothetical protein
MQRLDGNSNTMILTTAFAIAIIFGILDSFYTRKAIHSGKLPGVQESNNLFEYMLGKNE